MVDIQGVCFVILYKLQLLKIFHNEEKPSGNKPKIEYFSTQLIT